MFSSLQKDCFVANRAFSPYSVQKSLHMWLILYESSCKRLIYENAVKSNSFLTVNSTWLPAKIPRNNTTRTADATDMPAIV